MTTRSLSLFFIAFLLTGCGAASQWEAIRENRKGIEALRAEDPAAAGDHFIRGMAEQPFLSPFHHNLGLVLDIQKRAEDSQSSYRNADRLATDEDSKFFARFNLAEQLGRAKKIDEALEAYQSALEIRPDSVEVKTNIELLLQGGAGQGDGQQQQNQDGQGERNKDQNQKDGQDQQKDGDDQKQDKQYKNSPKYQPRPFKGEMSEADVKKILGEIRQQEQRIRAEYNRKDAKERPRDKDW